MDSKKKDAANYLFRVSSNLLVWVFVVLIVDGFPSWALGGRLSRENSKALEVIGFIDWKLWLTIGLAAILAAALVSFVASNNDVKQRNQFVRFLVEDVFGVVLNAGSLLAACSLWLLNWPVLVAAIISYSVGLRFWFILLPRPKQKRQRKGNPSASENNEGQ